MNIAVVEDLEVAHDNVACYLRESHLAEEQRIAQAKPNPALRQARAWPHPNEA